MGVAIKCRTAMGWGGNKMAKNSHDKMEEYDWPNPRADVYTVNVHNIT